jgi:hypothetical protein
MDKQKQDEKPKRNLISKSFITLTTMTMMMMIALITKHFQSFLKKKQGKKKFSNYKKDGNKKDSSKELLRCYKYSKTSHIKVDCPLL